MELPQSMIDMFEKAWDKVNNDSDMQINMMVDLLDKRGFDHQAISKFLDLFMNCTDKKKQDQLFVSWKLGILEKSLFRRKLVLNQTGMYMRQLILVLLAEKIGRPPPKIEACLGL